MIIPSNKIIIVDDQQDELDKLGKVFYASGIGCRTFLYDSLYDRPLDDVRIAFFDIKVNPSGGSSNEQTFSTLSNAIKLYISQDNSPFALIFWTSNSPMIEGFKQYMDARHSDTPKPYLINSIDKTEFLKSDDKLEEKVWSILTEKTLELMFEFENKAGFAASKTLKKIYDIIPKDNKWSETKVFNTNFKTIFAGIATHAVGEEHAQHDADKAIIESLVPIISYHLIQAKDKSWTEFLENDLKNRTYRKYPDGFNERELNSIFHIENVQNFNPDTRGGVYIYKLSNSCTITNVLDRRYYGELEIKAKDLFTLFIPFNENGTEISEREKVRSESDFILIESSAACDFSQNKKRKNKYLLGLMTPIIKTESIFKQSESIYKLPEFNLNKRDFQVWVNFNFMYSLPPGSKRLKNPIFIFKNELMTLIGSKYANHISRIGITTF